MTLKRFHECEKQGGTILNATDRLLAFHLKNSNFVELKMASIFANQAVRDEAASRVGSAGRETLATFTRSKLALNGAALAAAGFFGSMNIVNPADAIVSLYVLLGGEGSG